MLRLFKRYFKVAACLSFLLAATAAAVICAVSFSQKSNNNSDSTAANASLVSSAQDIVSSHTQESSDENPTSSDISSDISSETSSEDTPPPSTPKPVVINAYAPSQRQSCAAGSALTVTVAAHRDSTKVTATFNGQTINLVKQQYNGEPEYTNFSGRFILPAGNEKNLNLGKVKYYAERGGNSDTYYSGTITCLRDPACDRETVIEVVAESAETFNGGTVDDKSDPRLSPLPKGTVDYKVGDVIFDKESEKYYYKLRCGLRVYVDKPNPPNKSNYQVTAAYKGELPDSNKIALNTASVAGGYTYITFDTEWKAPFAVSVGPQNYNNPSIRDFTVQSVTSQYVDIKFYYTKTVDGDLSLPENPLFDRAQVLTQDGSAILRLYLKKTGGFYGWNAYYNSQSRLEFKFLNPKGAVSADNKYGADLTGITVMLDPGHGGRDPGAIGGSTYESERNLALAYKVKAELEGIGATVILTRSGDAELSTENRCSLMRNKAVDLCVSIHHNASNSASPNGADFYCFNAFSHNATKSLFEATAKTSIYKKVEKGWHYFYMGRVTSCPLVLIENGYMSNSYDLTRIKDENTNKQKAQHIAEGIANYFLSVK